MRKNKTGAIRNNRAAQDCCSEVYAALLIVISNKDSNDAKMRPNLDASPRGGHVSVLAERIIGSAQIRAEISGSDNKGNNS